MTLWNKCAKYTNCAVLSRFYKCKRYTIYFKCSFIKNIKTLKNRCKQVDCFQGARCAQNYVKVLHPPPPIRQRKEYGANGLFSKKFFQKEKFRNSKKIKFSKIEKEKIWIFVIFILPLHCIFHGNQIISGCCRCETVAIFVCVMYVRA